ncbi:MAG: LexA family transcriptional repressor [Achromobacter sp.]|uniref:S24 family peptidase n=1 Tax=Achromobacter sp. TaxID=134375 RepID=UPI0012C1A129|nr:LexA family transcriptional repressor [Achromobacter sp.]
MLNGTDLGAAIKAAIEKKIASGAVASQAAIARHFNVKPPSIHDWIKKGSISKDKLPELWRYFSDVVGPDHWGLKAWPDMGATTPEATPPEIKPWPFPEIPEQEVRALPAAQLNALQGALALAIAQLKIGIKVSATPAQKPASFSRGAVVDTHAADDAFPMADVLGKQAAGPGKVLVSANVTAGAPVAANDSFEPVPELADVRLAAGDGIENHAEDQTGVIQFRRSFLRSVGADSEKARVVYAKGDSMEPVIRDGASLLLIPNESLAVRDLAAGGVYAINYDGKMIVKTVAKDKLTGRWVARSFNPAYPDIPLENGHPVRVLGKVVWAGSKLGDEKAGEWVRS